MYNYPRAFKNPVLWVSKPQNVYRITTDQKTWQVKADWMNYKEKTKELYKQGYTNITITHLGRSI